MTGGGSLALPVREMDCSCAATSAPTGSQGGLGQRRGGAPPAQARAKHPFIAGHLKSVGLLGVSETEITGSNRAWQVLTRMTQRQLCQLIEKVPPSPVALTTLTLRPTTHPPNCMLGKRRQKKAMDIQIQVHRTLSGVQVQMQTLLGDDDCSCRFCPPTCRPVNTGKQGKVGGGGQARNQLVPAVTPPWLETDLATPHRRLSPDPTPPSTVSSAPEIDVTPSRASIFLP